MSHQEGAAQFRHELLEGVGLRPEARAELPVQTRGVPRRVRCLVQRNRIGVGRRVEAIARRHVDLVRRGTIERTRPLPGDRNARGLQQRLGTLDRIERLARLPLLDLQPVDLRHVEDPERLEHREAAAVALVDAALLTRLHDLVERAEHALRALAHPARRASAPA